MTIISLNHDPEEETRRRAEIYSAYKIRAMTPEQAMRAWAALDVLKPRAADRILVIDSSTGSVVG